MYRCMYIYIYIHTYHGERRRQGAAPPTSSRRTYPRPPIPAARLLLVSLCFSMFSSTCGNPEVGGGDNFLGSYPAPYAQRFAPCDAASWELLFEQNNK